MEEETEIKFKTELLSKIMLMSFKDKKTKISQEGLQLLAEFLKLFVAEATARSETQAQSEGVTAVEVDHLEKILPQLLLDF